MDWILSGFCLAGIVIKSYFLLLFRPEDFFSSDFVKSQIERYLMENKEVEDINEVRKFLTLVYNDKFTDETIQRSENKHLLLKLESLRTKLLDFYFTEVTKLDNQGSKIIRVCDIQPILDQLFLQLIRLRMVIEPEIQISQNIHPVSKISYIAVKSFWIDNDGVKKRDFTRSLGPLEDYGFKEYKKEIVSNDPKVKEESLKRIQEVIYNRYKEYYPE